MLIFNKKISIAYNINIYYTKNIYLSKTEENIITYKTFKNKLRSLIRKAKSNYYKKPFNSKTDSMKEMWKELGNLSNRKRKNDGNLTNKLIINNKKLNNDKDIANAQNTHFATIGENLADKAMPEENNSFKTYLHEPISNSLFLRPTDKDEILNEINQLKNKSTLDVKVTLLKYVKHEIVKGLVIIYNKSTTNSQTC